MFLKKLFSSNKKYQKLEDSPKKKCNECNAEFSKINYAVKKRKKIYRFCSETCYYNWLREKAGLEPY
jgi:hypothetical protein